MKKAEKSGMERLRAGDASADQTTGSRIVWAVDDCAPLGPEFTPQRELTAELRVVLRPRAQKTAGAEDPPHPRAGRSVYPRVDLCRPE